MIGQGAKTEGSRSTAVADGLGGEEDACMRACWIPGSYLADSSGIRDRNSSHTAVAEEWGGRGGLRVGLLVRRRLLRLAWAETGTLLAQQ